MKFVEVDHDGHLFWDCTWPPIVDIGESLSFGTLFLWAIQNGQDIYNGMVGKMLCLVRLVIRLGQVIIRHHFQQVGMRSRCLPTGDE